MKRALGLICLLGAAAALAASAPSCALQGEGQQCNHLNGNADCDTSQGLYCEPSDMLGNPYHADICCYMNGMQTSLACMPGGLVGEGGASGVGGSGGSGGTSVTTTTTTTTATTSTSSTTGTGGAAGHGGAAGAAGTGGAGAAGHAGTGGKAGH